MCVLASRESEALVHKANPVRKVVNMMRNMVTKVEEEGKKEEEPAVPTEKEPSEATARPPLVVSAAS